MIQDPMHGCVHCCTGVADSMSWLVQCQAKAISVRDILQLLVGTGGTTGTTASATADGADGGDAPATVALKGCLSTAVSLVQAIETQKKDMFNAWQVRASQYLKSCCSAMCSDCGVLILEFD